MPPKKKFGNEAGAGSGPVPAEHGGAGSSEEAPYPKEAPITIKDKLFNYAADGNIGELVKLAKSTRADIVKKKIGELEKVLSKDPTGLVEQALRNYRSELSTLE